MSYNKYKDLGLDKTIDRADNLLEWGYMFFKASWYCLALALITATFSLRVALYALLYAFLIRLISEWIRIYATYIVVKAYKDRQ